ncbi:MAG TPA: YciI family protein [Dehalococcoidia bacterium]|nr:YciI family protein [Dehalococcoidia bacterium]
MKYVLFYEVADDVQAKAPPHMPAHMAHIKAFHAGGGLEQVGLFGSPQDEGAMVIFSTREAAEAFAETDPFTLNGVVKRWYIRQWDEIYSRPAANS